MTLIAVIIQMIVNYGGELQLLMDSRLKHVLHSISFLPKDMAEICQKILVTFKTECTGKATEMENPSASNNFFPF